MIFSFNDNNREHEEANEDDEDFENDQFIMDAINTVQPDTLESEEIRYSNLIKSITDTLEPSSNLIYSREVPTRSMEVHGIDFKKRNNENEIIWLRFEVYLVSNAVRVDVVSSEPAEFDFYYSVLID